MSDRYFIIAGAGKSRYVKPVSKTRAKQLEQKDKNVFNSYYEAKQELERMRK